MLLCACAIKIAAQDLPKVSPPRIGTIKDYPATGLMTGCGNLYFHKSGAKITGDNYVFLSRGDGTNAWMNINGRDVRLRKIKTANRDRQKRRLYSYAYRQTRVTVVFEDFKAKADGSETEHMYMMTITVRKGGSVKIVHAIGDADC